MAKPIFRVSMLPAIQGDALWIEYGDADSPRRILIDGGPIGAYGSLEKQLTSLPEGDQRVELLVITHVDTDHIEGIIRLLAPKASDWPISPNDIWFNGWPHLSKSGMLGGREGDFLSALISRRAPGRWNKAFDGKAVVVRPDAGLPVVDLKEGMKITLLSPETDGLLKMAKKWAKDVNRAGFKPGDLEGAWEHLVAATKYHVEEGMLGGQDDFGDRLRQQLKVDSSVANETSIAFLAEFAGKRCLFLADAHAEVLCNSLRKLIPAGEQRLTVDAVKMAHHGSQSNISKELMDLVDAQHYLVSTSGVIHGHPDRAAIEDVINCSPREPTLWFNYCSAQNAAWAKGPQGGERAFKTGYPASKSGGITIDL